MKSFVGCKLSTVLSLVAVAGALGCGGGDKNTDTTPASTEAPPAQAATPPADQAATPPADQAATPPADQAVAQPAGGGLTEQLAQAQKVWGQSCTTCHGDNGEGKSKKVPVLVGAKALTKYKTGADLFAYVKAKMPKDDPGTLSETDYLSVTAWLLSKNGKLGETNDALTTASAASINLH
jgi:mono/diheme cytochrome c family protein